MSKKYFIRRTAYNGIIVYKRCKCTDGWSADKNACWKFSRQGALGIIKSLREHIPAYSNGRYSLDLVEAGDNEGRCR